ncbi:tyrosine-type recombinase/integrase [Desulfotomaculum defluvii]
MHGRIEKKGKDHYRIVIDLGPDPSDGKRKRIYKTVKMSKADAEVEMARMITELQNGAYVEPTKLTLESFLKHWLEVYGKTNLKPQTYDSYKMICEKHLIPNLGKMPLSKLHQTHLEQYQVKAMASGRSNGKGGLSARTVQYHHRVLGKALSYAVKMKILQYNIARDVSAPRAKKKEMRALTAQEVRQFLDTAKDHRDYLIVFTAVHTGMRRGEIIGLKWKDIDFKNRIARIQRSLQESEEEGIILGSTKNEDGRPVPLPECLCELLKEYKKTQVVNLFDKERLVFSDPDGDPVNPKNLSHRIENLAKKAGFPGINLHSLRHTWATLALESGIHPKVVQAILGHSNISITMDIYSHVLPVMFTEASNIVAQTISGINSKQEEKISGGQ